MYAPEGYIGFGSVSEFFTEFAGRFLLGHLMEEKGLDPKLAVNRDDDYPASQALLQFRQTQMPAFKSSFVDAGGQAARKNLSKVVAEDSFSSEIILHCLMAKYLMNSSPLLCSPDGDLIRPDNYVFLHQDRLDWVHPTWPLREMPELRRYFEFYDQGRFDASSIGLRYCFLDSFLGLLVLKNGSTNSFVRASHFGSDDTARNYLTAQVTPFLNRSVVWPESIQDTDFIDLFSEWGVFPAHWEIASLQRNHAPTLKRKTMRGAKPSAAKAEFLRRYPAGKPDGVSADAIAAELLEAGFQISGRQVNNWHKEITSK